MTIARRLLGSACMLLSCCALAAEEPAPDWAAIAAEIQVRPGDVAHALPRLERLLEAPAPFQDRAVQQLVALARVGAIPRVHDRLFEVLYNHYLDHIHHDRLFAASRVRDALVELGAANLRTDLMSWGLTLEAGDAQAAADAVRPYLARLGLLHSDGIVRHFLGLGREDALQRALREGSAASAVAPDPLRVVEAHDPASLVEALAEMAGAGLPAVDRLGTVVNPWWLLRVGLSSLDDAARTALVEAQGAASAAAGGDEHAVLASWRRQPAALQAQRALLELAWEHLHSGRRILAEACYQDLLAVAVDDQLRLDARRGLWLCWAGDPERREALAAALDAVDAPLPWGGKERSPAEVRKLLLPADVQSEPVDPDRLQVTSLHAPIAAGWSPALFGDYWDPVEFAGLLTPGLHFQAVDGLLLAAAPRILAAYDLEDPQRPLWTQVASGEWEPERLGSDERHLAGLGPFEPAIVNGTIYTRWGPAFEDWDERHPRAALRQRANLRAVRQVPNHIAAFDLRSGVMRWSTAGRVQAFDRLLPVADPVVDGDRVYVFCKDAERQSYRFALLCLDAADGSLRWSRELGHGGEFQDGDSRSQRSVAWNTAMYGAPPAIRDGVAYWASGGGFVIAVDLRDGLVLWRYDHAAASSSMHGRGSRPELLDDLVLVVAKDLRGMVALDRRTGAVAWSNPLLPAAEVVGRLGRLVVLRQADRIVGIDGRSGELRWSWEASGPIRGEVHQHAGDLVMAVDDRLVVLGIASGIADGGASFPGGRPQASFGLVGDRLVLLDPLAETTGPLPPRTGLLQRQTPRLYAGDDWGLLVSDDAIEGMDWAAGVLRWSRYKPFDLLDAAVVGNQAWILCSRGISALDAHGRRQWQRDLERVVDWSIQDGFVIIAEDAPGGHWYRVLRAEDGSEVLRVPRDHREHWGHDIRSVDAAMFGGAFHRVVHHVHRDEKRSFVEHVVQPLDGGVERRETVAEWEGERWWKGDGRDGRHLWFVTSGGTVNHLDLETGQHREMGRMWMNGEADRHARVELRVAGEVCLIDMPKRYDHSSQEEDIRQFYRLDRGQLNFERRSKSGESVDLREGAVWVRNQDRLLRLDEHGGEDLVLRLPRTPQGHAFTAVDWRSQGSDLIVLAQRQPLMVEHHGTWWPADRGSNDQDHFVLDRYGPEGELRARLLLPQLRPATWSLASGDRDHWSQIGADHWSSQALWDAQGLWLSTRDGVHRVDFEALPEHGRAGSNTQLLYRLDGRLAIDGRIDDWSAVSHVAQEREGARLLITHDRSHLLIAAIQPAADPLPLQGAGRFGGTGSWLQLDLRGNRFPIGGGSWQFDVGLARDGSTALGRLVPPGTQAVVRYDHASDSLIYELAVPVDPLRDPSIRLADEIQLAASCYTAGARQQAWRHSALRLHQYTTAQEAAGLQLAAAMPKLAESHLFLREILATHIGDWPEGKAFCRRLLEDHPAEPLAAAVLLHLDEVLHGDEEQREPDAELLALAQAAGVAEPQLAHYRSSMASQRRPYRDWHQIDWPQLSELDPARAQGLLEEQVLALGRAPAAVDFLRALRRLRELDAGETITLVRWFLERFPDHPRARDLLEDWWSSAQHVAGSEQAARESMDADLDQMSALSWRLVYDFRRSMIHREHAPVNEWHVVGPFPSLGLMDYDYGVPLPPRLQQVTLKERYRLPGRTLSWRPLTCGSARVPISHWLGNPLEPSIAYCVTWVKSPDSRQVALELDADGPSRVWVNRVYVHGRSSNLDQGPLHVPLAAGWNAILVEQAMAPDGGWTFQLELVERAGKGPLEDLEFLAVNGHKPVNEPVAVDPAKLQPGLQVEVFRGSWRELPNFDLEQPEARLVSPRVDLSVTPHRDQVGLRFTGLVKIDQLDFYTFSTISDDGSQLFISDQVVVDNDGLHGAEERFGTVTLKPGYYPITITMFENQGGEHLEAFWRRHDGEKIELEGDALWHRP